MDLRGEIEIEQTIDDSQFEEGKKDKKSQSSQKKVSYFLVCSVILTTFCKSNRARTTKSFIAFL